MLNLDTHILIDALKGNLKATEHKLLTHHDWGISAIVFWEICKLSQLGRIEMNLEDPEVSQVMSSLHVWPIDLDVCQQIKNLDFKSDPADEIIAATSVVHKIPLLTRDKKILKSRITPLARQASSTA